MTSLKNKAKAETDKIVGTAKEAAGKALGNPKLESEGQDQRVKGNVQNAVDGVKDAVKSIVK